MKIIISLSLSLLLVYSCKHSSEKKTGNTQIATKEKPSFFPLTEYIKGQIREITDRQVNPLEYVTVNDRTDSSWLKIEDLPQAFSDFLHPQIDSVNMVTLFKESRFMDQTINAFTFTYDPIAALPDSMALQHWDVYIDPASGKVRRVYMVKSAGEGMTKQLTWQGDKWCRIVDIVNKQDGTSVIEKEVKITWEF